MGILSFYNTRKPRQFEHKPIYWDPRKEEMEKRIQKVKRELGVLEVDENNYKSEIKGSFVEGTRHLRKSRMKGNDARSLRYKNARLGAILIFLAILFYYVFIK